MNMSLTEEEKAYIEEEEKLFEKTLESLCQQLPIVQEAKVNANQAARELTKKVVNEWNDEERQPLISDEAVAHSVWISVKTVIKPCWNLFRSLILEEFPQ